MIRDDRVTNMLLNIMLIMRKIIDNQVITISYNGGGSLGSFSDGMRDANPFWLSGIASYSKWLK